jgi:hypothetical protein
LITRSAIGSISPAIDSMPKSQVTSNVTCAPPMTGRSRHEPWNSAKSPSVCAKSIRRSSVDTVSVSCQRITPRRKFTAQSDPPSLDVT